MPSAAWPAPHGKVCVVASSQKCCRLTLPLPLHLVSFDKESKDSYFLFVFPSASLGPWS